MESKIARRIVGKWRLREAKRGIPEDKLRRMFSEPGRVGVMSPWRMNLPRSENKERTSQFVRDLQSMGYRDFYTGNGKWDPDNLPERRTSKWEAAFLIPDIRFADIVDLGYDYNQDAVIWKGPEGVTGMYFLRSGEAVPATKIPETGRKHDEDREFYTEFRNTGYDIDFHWDYRIPFGSGPIGWDDLATAGFFDDGSDEAVSDLDEVG